MTLFPVNPKNLNEAISVDGVDVMKRDAFPHAPESNSGASARFNDLFQRPMTVRAKSSVGHSILLVT
jgi:hypothetical protein